MSNRSKTSNIGTAERSIQLIEILRQSGGSTAAELAEELPMAKSSVYKHLNTLNDNNYVTKNGEEYTLSMRFVSIGEEIKQKQINSYQFITDTVKEIASITEETVWFVVKNGSKGLIVNHEVGSKGIETGRYHPGDQVPLHASASGKAIFAYLSDDEIDRILAKRNLQEYTANTTTEIKAICEELSEVREQGVAFNDSESVSNIRAVGVPVLDPTENVLGALSVSGPKSRIKGEFYQKELPEILIEKSNLIEINAMAEHRSEW